MRPIDSQIEGLSSDTRWTQPGLYDLNKRDDCEKLSELIQAGLVFKKYNTPLSFIRGLVNPEATISHDDDSLEYKHTSDNNIGVWVLYPWSGDLVRFPSRDDYYWRRTNRFRDLIPSHKQARLRLGRVATIGQSVGGTISLATVAAGIGNSTFISDIKNPDIPNIGRGNFDVRDLQGPKIDAIAKRISYLDPFVEQNHAHGEPYTQLEERLLDYHPDIIIDQVDSMETSIRLREFCKRERLPYVTVSDVHDLAVLEIVRHDLSSREPLFVQRVSRKIQQRLLAGEATDEDSMRVFAESIGFHRLTLDLIDSVLRIGEDISGIPQLGTTALVAAGLATATTRDIMLGEGVRTGVYTLDTAKANFKKEKIKKIFKTLSRYSEVRRVTKGD